MGLDISVYRICDGKKGSGRDFEVEKNFPEFVKKHGKSTIRTFYDYERYFSQVGFDESRYKFLFGHYGGEGDVLCFVRNERYEDDRDFLDEKKMLSLNTDTSLYEDEYGRVLIDLEKVPTVKKRVKVVYVKQCGYQRKGLNSKFYEDEEAEKIGYYVWTLEELLRFQEEYCDDEAQKDSFQHNIIDKFVEGECFVTFDY